MISSILKVEVQRYKFLMPEWQILAVEMQAAICTFHLLKTLQLVEQMLPSNKKSALFGKINFEGETIRDPLRPTNDIYTDNLQDFR